MGSNQKNNLFSGDNRTAFDKRNEYDAAFTGGDDDFQKTAAAQVDQITLNHIQLEGVDDSPSNLKGKRQNSK